jgi:hypothetical protein
VSRCVADPRTRANGGRTLTAVSRVAPTRRADVLPESARCVIDYALARRAALTTLTRGRERRTEICDAQPYLLRAARYHGERRDIPCPVCQGNTLMTVSYTYGDCFRGDTNGRARATRELDQLAADLAEFSVFVVEVCTACRWNHLLTSYVLGHGQPSRRRARS